MFFLTPWLWVDNQLALLNLLLVEISRRNYDSERLFNYLFILTEIVGHLFCSYVLFNLSLIDFRLLIWCHFTWMTTWKSSTLLRINCCEMRAATTQSTRQYKSLPQIIFPDASITHTNLTFIINFLYIVNYFRILNIWKILIVNRAIDFLKSLTYKICFDNCCTLKNEKIVDFCFPLSSLVMTAKQRSKRPPRVILSSKIFKYTLTLCIFWRFWFLGLQCFYFIIKILK